MAADDADGDTARETVVYQFEMDRETWRAWTNCVPRETPLATRLRTLIGQDLDAARHGGYDDMEERTARLLANRIYNRGRTALSALEDGDDDKVATELEKICETAKLFEE